MPIFSFNNGTLTELEQTEFAEEGLLERRDLQAVLRDKIEAIAPNCMVLAEEFSDWADSNRRIDLLAIDRDANLVVIELKRDTTGSHMELQALRYASMVSTLTFKRAVEILDGSLRKQEKEDDAETVLLNFLGWDEPKPSDFALDVRIILASQDFSKELTTSVLWLLDHSINISCVRMTPHKSDSGILIDIQQIIPLREAEEFQVRFREQAEERRETGRWVARHFERYEFWKTFLQGSGPHKQFYANISPSKENWIAASAGKSGVSYNIVVLQHDSRVELWIASSDSDLNRKIFDALFSHKAQIEGDFNAPLDWEPLEGKIACRIAYRSDVGGYRDPDLMPAIHEWMAEHIQKLRDAVQPFLQQL